MDFDSGADDGEEVTREGVEYRLISHGKETHLPSLVNMGGCELVLESVSGDQRHRRGGECSDSLVVVAGPCAMLCVACCDVAAATARDALAFDLRAGIWPTLPRQRKMHQPPIRHSPVQIRKCFFFFFSYIDWPPSPYARTECLRFLPTEKGLHSSHSIVSIRQQHKQGEHVEIHRE